LRCQHVAAKSAGEGQAAFRLGAIALPCLSAMAVGNAPGNAIGLALDGDRTFSGADPYLLRWSRGRKIVVPPWVS
jgi:hypothetical protein